MPGDDISKLEAAARSDPSNAETHFQLANALRRAGQFQGAANAYNECLRRKPDHILALNNLGAIFGAVGRLDLAAQVFSRAAQLHPERAVAHQNLGSVLLAMRRFDEAHDALARAVRLDANHFEALVTLANLYKEIGEVDRAIDCDRRASSIRPDNVMPADDLCYSIQYSPRFDAEAIRRELSTWSVRHAEALGSKIQEHPNDRNLDRRLRVGYVSPNFRDHCQALFMIPLLSRHDARSVEVFCYSDVERPDDTTQRIQGFSHQWRVIAGTSDDQVTAMIRADTIDVLVDLTMHMTSNRLRVFAQKPAPVQIAWLAYPGSTGMKAIDYRLSDPYLDPPGADDSIYAERTLRLPETFWCYDPLVSDLSVNALSSLNGAPFTFGCLNHFLKVNDAVLNLWGRMLREVSHSRMMILCDPGRHRQRVLDALAIDPVRVTFRERRPRRKYLELYHQIDLGLDTVPYNGHTTSLDAMWMGVPTVTLVGPTIVGRAGLSQLSNVGLTEFVARSEDQYVRIANEWSNHRQRLAELRSTLRDRMRESPLGDAPRFARSMEAAYRVAWRSWCGG